MIYNTLSRSERVHCIKHAVNDPKAFRFRVYNRGKSLLPYRRATTFGFSALSMIEYDTAGDQNPCRIACPYICFFRNLDAAERDQLPDFILLFCAYAHITITIHRITPLLARPIDIQIVFIT